MTACHTATAELLIS